MIIYRLSFYLSVVVPSSSVLWQVKTPTLCPEINRHLLSIIAHITSIDEQQPIQWDAQHTTTTLITNDLKLQFLQTTDLQHQPLLPNQIIIDPAPAEQHALHRTAMDNMEFAGLRTANDYKSVQIWRLRTWLGFTRTICIVLLRIRLFIVSNYANRADASTALVCCVSPPEKMIAIITEAIMFTLLLLNRVSMTTVFVWWVNRMKPLPVRLILPITLSKLPNFNLATGSHGRLDWIKIFKTRYQLVVFTGDRNHFVF